jgi:hypothetical protein
MTPRVIVRCVLLAADQLLRVEQLTVGTRADLIYDGGLEVEEHCARHVLPSACLAEERVERIVLDTDGLVGGHRAVRLNAMFETK